MKEKIEKYIKWFPAFNIGWFLINNLIFRNFYVSGILYGIVQSIIILLNIAIIFKYNKKMKYKRIFIFISLFLIIFCKNIYYLFFCISNILSIIFFTIFYDKIVLAITIIGGILIAINYKIFYFLFLILLLYFSKPINEIGVYEDSHQYCHNSYEVYMYSAGAFDKYHFMVGKNREIINIKKVLKINYISSHEKTEKDYNDFIVKNGCHYIAKKSKK